MPVPLDYQVPSHHPRWSRLLARFRSPDARFFLLNTFGAVLTLVPPIIGRREPVWVLGLYGNLIVLCCLWMTCTGKVEGKAVGLGVRLMTGAIAVNFLSALFWVQSCPHATYVCVGPFLITVLGEACNNQQPEQFWTWWLMDRLT